MGPVRAEPGGVTESRGTTQVSRQRLRSGGAEALATEPREVSRCRSGAHARRVDESDGSVSRRHRDATRSGGTVASGPCAAVLTSPVRRSYSFGVQMSGSPFSGFG